MQGNQRTEADPAAPPMMEVAGPIVDQVDENFMLRYLDGSRLGGSPGEHSGPSDIEREAQHFLDSYAADLRRHDRAALAARYNRDGATVIFNGERNAGTFDEIEARYREQCIERYSYSGIVQRQEGELRIRLEVESLLPDSKDGPP